MIKMNDLIDVSTHSRPKAAGLSELLPAKRHKVSTHSRPKAAGQTWVTQVNPEVIIVSTHSRPKAAGGVVVADVIDRDLFQHTAARRRLEHPWWVCRLQQMFQHTAARRRLGPYQCATTG